MRPRKCEWNSLKFPLFNNSASSGHRSGCYEKEKTWFNTCKPFILSRTNHSWTTNRFFPFWSVHTTLYLTHNRKYIYMVAKCLAKSAQLMQPTWVSPLWVIRTSLTLPLTSIRIWIRNISALRFTSVPPWLLNLSEHCRAKASNRSIIQFSAVTIINKVAASYSFQYSDT